MFAQLLVVEFRYDVSVASVGDVDGLASPTLISDSKTCWLNLILHSFQLFAFQSVQYLYQ